ncbi:MAG: SDR family oxidoreductase [Candidatus Promineifilaceae bacterium]
MKIEFEGKRVIVTAGARGIGRAIADAFAAAGAQVHICDIDATAVANALAENPKLTGSITDVSDESQVDTMFDEALAHLGGLDIMVNNAGISGPAGMVEEIAIAAWEKVMAVNVYAMISTSRRAIPIMKAQRSGSIINIASTAGLWGYPTRSPYCASKWAVIGLTKTMAMELGEYDVRVNVICPGSVSGPRIDHVIAIQSAATGMPEDEIRRSYTNQVSMQTFVDPEEIAYQALFVCSPFGAKISGQALCVDGHTESMRT